MAMTKLYMLALCILPFSIAAQNYLNIGPVPSSTEIQGRISASGSAAEISLLKRSHPTFVESPTMGERWSVYNDGKLKFWSGGDKLTMTHDGNVGIGTTTPGAWFPSKTLEIYDTRPVLKLASTNSTGFSTIVFTNTAVPGGNAHTGEFHINHQFNASDNSKSLLRFNRASAFTF